MHARAHARKHRNFKMLNVVQMISNERTKYTEIFHPNPQSFKNPNNM